MKIVAHTHTQNKPKHAKALEDVIQGYTATWRGSVRA